MPVCSRCGQENPDGFRFCGACAAPLDAVDAPGREERKIVTVVYVDLVGSTSRAEALDPEDVRTLLAPYHQRVRRELERHGGTMEKFIGDAVVGLFGAPTSHEDDPERAVRAALAVLDAIEDLNATGLDLEVRVGVATGEALVSVDARPDAGDALASGDVMNTGARLQAAAPVGGVLVTAATYRATEHAVEYEPATPVAAKGKAEPVEAWRALRPRSRVGEAETDTSTPLIGREHELTLLVESLARAERESTVHLVTITGEPGVGKSRLVAELRHAVDARPDLVSWRHGRCLPYGEGITFWALGEIVKAEAGILETDDTATAGAKLERAVSTVVGDEAEREWLVRRLGALVGVEAAAGASPEREESFTAWRRFLEALAEERPLVAVFEDLHWADGALLEFLEHVLDWAVPVPLLLVCTARPELYERAPGWGGGKRNTTTISLAPLPPVDTARLVHALSAHTVMSVETQKLLLERSGGNPLYAEQFVRMLAESDSADELSVPETVHALIAARLDTLPPDQKALLQDAAVVGGVFWAGAVAALGQRERPAVSRSLRELVPREFVRPRRSSSIAGDEELTFWHALVRDVAYEQLPRGVRARKHLAAAEWIETSAGERIADHAEILVHHHEQAMTLLRAAGEDVPVKLTARLVQLHMLAGGRAEHLDHAAAVAAYERAATLAQPGSVEWGLARLAVGLALVDQHGIDEGWLALQDALPVLRAAGDLRSVGSALGGLGRACWFRGDIAQGDAFDREAIELLKPAPGPELVYTYGRLAASATIEGRPREGLVLAETALSIAAELDVADVVRPRFARGMARFECGDVGGLDDIREAVALGQRLGLSSITSIAMNNLADYVGAVEGHDAGLQALDDAIAFSRRRALGGREMWQRVGRLSHLYALGRWGELLTEGEEIVPWAQAKGSTQLEGFARARICAISTHRGQADGVAAEMETWLPWAREMGEPQQLVPWLAAAIDLAAARSRREDVTRLAREVSDVFADSPLSVPAALPQAVRACRAVGDAAAATLLMTSLSTHGTPADEAAVASAQALVAELDGDAAGAAALHADAAARWEAHGHVVEQGYSLLGLGRCSGDANALARGRGVFERLGAAPISQERAT